MIEIFTGAGAAIIIGICVFVAIKKKKEKSAEDVKTQDFDEVLYDNVKQEKLESVENIVNPENAGNVIIEGIKEDTLDKKAAENFVPKEINEQSYLEEYGLIRDGVKLPHIIVKYYNGHPKIDLLGSVEEKRFYMWMSNEIVYLLDFNFINSAGMIELPLQEIEYFMFLREEVSMIRFIYMEKYREIFLDINAYKLLKSFIPFKEKKLWESKDINKLNSL